MPEITNNTHQWGKKIHTNMKKTFLILCLIAAILLCSCTEEQDNKVPHSIYKTYIVDTSGAPYSTAPEISWQRHCDDQPENKEITVEINGKTYECTFYKCTIGARMHKKIYEYQGNGISVRINPEDGSVIGYFLGPTAVGYDASLPFLTEEEVLDIAKEIASKHIDLNSCKTQVISSASSVHENMRNYSVYFRKTIDGYPTSCFYVVQMTSQGIVYGEAAYDFGSYDNGEFPDFDIDQVYLSIDEKLHSYYDGKYSFTYEIQENTDPTLVYVPETMQPGVFTNILVTFTSGKYKGQKGSILLVTILE